MVEIYELSSKSSFQEAQRKDFWSAKSPIEGVVESRTIDLYPDSTLSFKLEFSDETKYIGVAANLIEPDPPEAWRRVYPVEEVDRLQVTVRNTRITVKVREVTTFEDAASSENHWLVDPDRSKEILVWVPDRTLTRE